MRPENIWNCGWSPNVTMNQFKRMRISFITNKKGYTSMFCKFTNITMTFYDINPLNKERNMIFKTLKEG